MKHLKVFISALILLGALSCTKNQTDGTGQVIFEVQSRQDIVEVTKSQVSDYTTPPSASDFEITIKDSKNETFWTGKVSEWVSSTPLLAGTYTVEASYGSFEEEGFDKPYFFGETSFEVKGGLSVAVPIEVSLANTIIKVECTDNFKNYFKDYTFTLTRDGSDVVEFTKTVVDAGSAAFIDGYKIKVEGTLVGEFKTQTFAADYSDLDVAKAYTLEFDAPNVGGSTITISFNHDVMDVELGDVELNE